GGSMVGQETLLLLAKHPHLLAGAISFDAPTNMAERYGEFPLLKRGLHLQQLARLEFGGVPRAHHEAWADRSPLFYAREIAFSNVPLEIWWSTKDKIVVDGAMQSGLLYRAIKRINPRAPPRAQPGIRRCAELGLPRATRRGAEHPAADAAPADPVAPLALHEPALARRLLRGRRRLGPLCRRACACAAVARASGLRRRH